MRSHISLRIEKIYKQEGFFCLIQRILIRSFHIFLEMNNAIWFERDLLEDIDEFIPKIPVEVNFEFPEETVEWMKNQRDNPWIYNKNEVIVGLKEGHYYPSIKYNGEIIGYIKVGKNGVYIADYKKTIRFPPEIAFIYDSYVVPQHRGLGVAPYSINEVMKFSKNKGFTKLRCHIPPWNNASIRAYTKAKFKRIKRIFYFRIFGFKILTGNPTI